VNGLRAARRKWALLTVLLLVLAGGAIALRSGLRGKVLWIYDGDTIKVAGVGKVRLLGIDAPEHEDSPRDRYYMRQGISRQRLRRIAQEALRFNIERVKGRTVSLQLDHDKRDRYGRLLAYVVLPDGRMLNRLLLEKGYAAVYRRFDFRLKQDFLRAEAEARRRRVGLWQK
jgi:micrococcal nuclease